MTLRRTVTLPGGVEAPAEARRRVLEEQREIPEGIRDDLMLMVSEVVTNAISHGSVGEDDELRVEIIRRGSRFTVRVYDKGTGFRPVLRAPDEEGRGLGLVVIDRLAHRWGVEHARGGTCVWFELTDGAGRGTWRDQADHAPVEDARAGRYEIDP